jgi:hypothetical protein
MAGWAGGLPIVAALPQKALKLLIFIKISAVCVY